MIPVAHSLILALCAASIPTNGNMFGTAVSSLGDFNHDNIGDIAISDIAARSTSGKLTGAVHVVSGIDGKPLFTVWGDKEEEYFGSTVVATGDLNNDLVPDFACGSLGIQAGGLRLVSGGDQGALLQVPLPPDAFRFAFSGIGPGPAMAFLANTGNSLGRLIIGPPHQSKLSSPDPLHLMRCISLDGLPVWTLGVEGVRTFAMINDLDGDHWRDIVACKYSSEDKPEIGTLIVVSGQDGRVLHSHTLHGVSHSFGSELITVQDRDGDPFDDIIVVDYKQSPPARIVSSVAGKVISVLSVPGHEVGDYVIMSEIHDTDNDGIADLVVGTPEFAHDESTVFVCSGASGKKLRALDVELATSAYWPTLITKLADIDGDGYGEICISANSWRGWEGGCEGTVGVFSSKTLECLYALNISNGVVAKTPAFRSLPK